ncbi:MAG: hypothetical protein Q7K65_04435 [Candidatus Buchananbacteria bacterium]|nr:hypothetical protein [Candidatus Buchananbacteria bacterium]
MPQVLITQSAWTTIAREVSFFDQQNKEAIIYPLFGFIRKDNCLKAPWTMLTLDDIKYFIVTHAFAPPRELCHHSVARAGFMLLSEEDEIKWEEALKAWYQPLCQRFPTLEIGNVHSHQFARYSTWPSSGGQSTDYYRIYKFWQHLRTRKLDTPLEIIICQGSYFRRIWRACCFGFGETQNIVSLGPAKIITDDHPLAAQILTPPFNLTSEGLFWKLEQSRKLPQIESFDNYYFGWISCKIRLAENKYLFVNFPPSFPSSNHVLWQTLDAEKKLWQPMKRLNVNGFNFQLTDLVKEII